MVCKHHDEQFLPGVAVPDPDLLHMAMHLLRSQLTASAGDADKTVAPTTNDNETNANSKRGILLPPLVKVRLHVSKRLAGREDGWSGNSTIAAVLLHFT